MDFIINADDINAFIELNLSMDNGMVIINN
jgi:hypothetical protein